MQENADAVRQRLASQERTRALGRWENTWTSRMKDLGLPPVARVVSVLAAASLAGRAPAGLAAQTVRADWRKLHALAARLAAKKTAKTPAPVDPDDEDETVACPSCGAMNDSDAKRCDQCGAELPGDKDDDDKDGDGPSDRERALVTRTLAHAQAKHEGITFQPATSRRTTRGFCPGGKP